MKPKVKEKMKERSKFVKVVKGKVKTELEDKLVVKPKKIKPVVKANSLREVSLSQAPRLSGDVNYWGPNGESMDNPLFDNGEVRGDQSADAYYNLDKLKETFDDGD